MTQEDLKQLRPINALIRVQMQRISDLRAAAGVQSPRLDAIPSGSGPRDKIGAIVPQIIDQENELIETLRMYYDRKRELDHFIDTIQDFKVRLIAMLRYRDGLPWESVADEIGGRATGYSVKHACQRYFERINKNDSEGK